MKPRLSHIAYTLVVILGLSSLACAGMQRASDRQRYIERELTKHVYTQPIENVMPHARKLLFKQGFQVRDTSETTMETEYLQNGNYEDRYLVTAMRAGNGWKVEITLDRVNQRNGRAQSERDFDMEWELLKHADPRTAHKIDREADAYADSRS